MTGRTTASLLLLLASAAAQNPPTSTVVWQTNLGRALAEAKRTNKPVLVYVYDSI